MGMDLLYQANINLKYHMNHLKELRDYFISRLQEVNTNININGDLEKRLPGNINICLNGIEGETILLKLDENGICASSGSACTSGNSEPSHVLKAIGLSDELSRSSLRLTFGEENKKEDIDFLINCLKNIVNEFTN